MRIFIAGGGSGGHIYPALAVARALRALPNAPELTWIGGHRGLEAGIVPGAGIPFRLLPARSLRTVGRDIHLLLDPLRLLLSIPVAAWLLGRGRPAAVFTTGGYIAVPVVLVARLLRIPVLLWDGNVIPGRSVRAVARFADAIAVSFGETAAALAGSGRPCFVTGTPIRDTRQVDRLAARERLGIPPGARVLLVFGGSQAVRRFNAAVEEALPRLVERVHLVHVTGEAGYAAALTARERLPEELRDRYRPDPFLGDLMLPALAAADLVVGRAGSSTLAEVAALGLPLVVVPYPHAAGHQRANARRFVETGAAILVDDERFDAAALLEAATILMDPARHVAMAAAARELGRPAAAEAAAAVLLALAERRTLPTPETVERIARGIAA